MHILVDQDGVIADWSSKFEQRIVERFPDIDFPFLKDNANWDMSAGLDKTGKAAIETILTLPRFYADLEPIPGAVTALKEIVKAGHTVSICTSPYISNPTCASDKIAWLERHIGRGWGKCAIITSDKTQVRGDILIDDRPEISGVFVPTWEHVLFNAPYNRTVNDGRRRLADWSEWRTLVSE